MNEHHKVIETYSPLSQMELSDEEQGEIWMNVERRMNSGSLKIRKRRSNVFGTSVAVVAAVAIVAGGFYAFSTHSFTGKTNHPSVTTVSDKTPKRQNSFNFSQYLSFTPLLPKYTAGHRFTSSQVTRYLGTQQNPKTNAISYTASYGNGFVVIEGRPNELHLGSMPFPKTHLVLTGEIHATMQKHDGGESIDFTHDGLLYDVTTINAGVSLQELEKVCASINVPATHAPGAIHLSAVGPQSVNELSFTPIRAGQFSVPNGYSLNFEGSAINIIGSSRSESFQITYRKDSSYLTVTQSTGSRPGNMHNTAYYSKLIHGVKVVEQHTTSMDPVAVFTLPQTHVHVVVYSNISSGDVGQVLDSFLNTAMNNASH